MSTLPKSLSAFLYVEDLIPHFTTSLGPNINRQLLMSYLIHVRVIPQGTIYQLRGTLVCTVLHARLILTATTDQVPISYRGTLLSILFIH
jgi:hypothetical protein